MRTIQVKGVPDEVHAELKRRAGQRGSSIRDYVLELIRRDQTRPSPADWLEEVESLPTADLGGMSSAQMIREGRAERDRELAGRMGFAEPDE